MRCLHSRTVTRCGSLIMPNRRPPNPHCTGASAAWVSSGCHTVRTVPLRNYVPCDMIRVTPSRPLPRDRDRDRGDVFSNAHAEVWMSFCPFDPCSLAMEKIQSSSIAVLLMLVAGHGAILAEGKVPCSYIYLNSRTTREHWSYIIMP